MRSAGWATDEGEFDVVSNCIAAPVWAQANRVAGAISITSFREKADIPALLAHLDDLLATTREISHELGWRADDAASALASSKEL